MLWRCGAGRLNALQGVVIPRFVAMGYWGSIIEVFIATSFIWGSHPLGGGADAPHVLDSALQVRCGSWPSMRCIDDAPTGRRCCAPC